jgi:hypothetical protein
MSESWFAMHPDTVTSVLKGVEIQLDKAPSTNLNQQGQEP